MEGFYMHKEKRDIQNGKVKTRKREREKESYDFSKLGEISI